ncbi:hypothetical protein V491_04815 [Pseudogymnoascus sp. VKM F-3775]|nr:hypothetical protein V491_04815 [Pseudogymnoascus sp. VKM F-3775]
MDSPFHLPDEPDIDDIPKSIEEYRVIYEKSIKDPESFWAGKARKLLDWERDFKTIHTGNFKDGDNAWFQEGRLNASYNCIDRHAIQDPNKVAVVFEADEVDIGRKITYSQLLHDTSRLSFVLKDLGIRKGDIVCIYLPNIYEALVAMLACSRIGAVHSVVFMGFSAAALRDRILDGRSKIVITAGEGRRGGKAVPTKAIVNEALLQCPQATSCLVLKHTGSTVPWCPTRDVWWHEEAQQWPAYIAPESMSAEVFEGTPTYPSFSRYWDIVEEHRVTHFYAAPTALRILKRAGDSHITAPMENLRVLGSIGEPIAPEVWKWYHETVGRKRAYIVDTYFQTETGCHVISPLVGSIPTKPGCCTVPFLGIEPVILDPITDKELDGPAEDLLAIKRPWPSMARTVWRAHKRYLDTYFNEFPGYYFTGDGAFRDEDGYYWIRGRVDDVVNVSGHRLSTAEIEVSLLESPYVAESAAVGLLNPATIPSIIKIVQEKLNPPTPIVENPAVVMEADPKEEFTIIENVTQVANDGIQSEQ